MVQKSEELLQHFACYIITVIKDKKQDQEPTIIFYKLSKKWKIYDFNNTIKTAVGSGQSEQIAVTDVELEDSSGALRVALPMQLHLFCLSVLRLQGAAAQEGDAVREAQLPALSVGFKVHHQGLKGVKRERCVKRGGGIKKTRCQNIHRKST